jgi:uncharacterized LabA/DUF88 family protein
MSMLLPEYHFIDGENLVMRYQAMLAEGRTPLPGTPHRKDVYVFPRSPEKTSVGDIRRISYYTSAAGDDDRIQEIAAELHALQYRCTDSTTTKEGHLHPRVFKKAKQTQKTRSVDINITIDALRHATNGTARHISIYSGDADFIPLIEELMHLGVDVHVKAFSSGLSPRMKTVADEFFLLDSFFFCIPSAPKDASAATGPGGAAPNPASP